MANESLATSLTGKLQIEVFGAGLREGHPKTWVKIAILFADDSHGDTTRRACIARLCSVI